MASSTPAALRTSSTDVLQDSQSEYLGLLIGSVHTSAEPSFLNVGEESKHSASEERLLLRVGLQRLEPKAEANP